MRSKIITLFIFLLLFISLYGLNLYPNISTILGGVALFLIGMEYMESGFKVFSGGVLERILKRFTSNTPKAILTGFISTSIVQSSSLVSVIIIGFLSAKLITLTSAVGVILGSNIGTTTTAWIVSYFGLKIKISIYAFPMIIIGVATPIIFKSITYRGIASVLIGVGVIFLGIGYMKEGFETLKDGIDLAQYAMSGYLGIFIYIFVGIIATVIIQSSSATMAIIITALATNQISYENALALAIGANVGTTITAILGALKSNENGKRLAVAHFIFNIITAIIAIIFIYQLADLVDYISLLLNIDNNNYSMKLALFHTIFNVIGVIIVSIFIRRLVKFLNTLFIPKWINNGKVKYLDKAILELPSTAIKAIRKESRHLYRNSFEIIIEGLNLKHKNIISSMPLENVINYPYSKYSVDIDILYNRNIKSIYSEIIYFASKAQESMSQEDIEILYNLKLANKYMVEAIKNTKHLQKNLIKYSNSPNEHIKKQYSKMRLDLAGILRNINIVASTKDEDKIIISLSKIKLYTKKYDIISNGVVDNLIRKNLITKDMATSLMNDSTYSYGIATSLIKMAEIMFISRDIDIHSIRENILISDEDINIILSKDRR